MDEREGALQRPWRRVMLAQGLAVVLLLAAVYGLALLSSLRLPLWLAALAQGALAAAIGWRLGLSRWWLGINLAFLPALWLLQQAALGPAGEGLDHRLDGVGLALDDRLVQVKCRVKDAFSKASQSFSPFRSFAFDSCVFVVLDSVTYKVVSAIEVDREVVETSAKLSRMGCGEPRDREAGERYPGRY